MDTPSSGAEQDRIAILERCLEVRESGGRISTVLDRLVPEEAVWIADTLGLLDRVTVLLHAPDPNAFPKVDGFTILSYLGFGATGVVYKAVQEWPPREVALKVLRRDSPAALNPEHFSSEVTSLAELAHPNIATIFNVGTTADARPYFAMELLGDVAPSPMSLTTWAAGVPWKAWLGAFAEICDTIQHVHDQGWIHGDLKSAHVRMCLVQARVIPKLIDFGAAHQPGERARAFTKGFAAPEHEQLGPCTEAADIYALGAILRELCSADAARHAISPATPLRRPGHRKLPGDLRFVLDRCSRALPEQRYTSARELAADIRRVLEQRPVSAFARAHTWRYVAGRYLVRNSVAVLAATLLVGFALWGDYASVASARERQARLLTRAQEMAHRFEIAAEHLAIHGELGEASRQHLDALEREIHQIEIEMGPSPSWELKLELHCLHANLATHRLDPKGAAVRLGAALRELDSTGQDPASATLRSIRRVQLRTRLAGTLADSGDRDGAATLLELANATAIPSASDPLRPALLREVANAKFNQAVLIVGGDDFAAADAAFAKAQELSASAGPEGTRLLQGRIGLSRANLADRLQNHQQARALYADAALCLEAELGTSHTVECANLLLAALDGNALATRRQLDPKAALSAFAHSSERAEEFQRRFPESRLLLPNLARAFLNAAACAEAAEVPIPEYRHKAETALELATKALALFPQEATAVQVSWNAKLVCARTRIATGHFEAGLELLSPLLAESAAKEAIGCSNYRKLIAIGEAHEAVGVAARASGKPSAATSPLLRQLDFLGKAAECDPGPGSALRYAQFASRRLSEVSPRSPHAPQWLPHLEQLHSHVDAARQALCDRSPLPSRAPAISRQLAKLAEAQSQAPQGERGRAGIVAALLFATEEQTRVVAALPSDEAASEFLAQLVRELLNRGQRQLDQAKLLVCARAIPKGVSVPGSAATAAARLLCRANALGSEDSVLTEALERLAPALEQRRLDLNAVEADPQLLRLVRHERFRSMAGTLRIR